MNKLPIFLYYSLLNMEKLLNILIEFIFLHFMDFMIIFRCLHSSFILEFETIIENWIMLNEVAIVIPSE